MRYKTTKRLLLQISGQKELMDNYPEGKASIEIREQIVLPLLTIQQYALKQIQNLKIKIHHLKKSLFMKKW